jgi:hypothetical protein
MRARASEPAPVELPAPSGQLRFVDEHGHSVSACRRGHNSWVLDHTSHGGGEVLRFFSTTQLVHELNRRGQDAIEVMDALPS